MTGLLQVINTVWTKVCTIFINRQRIKDNNRSAIEVDTDHMWLILLNASLLFHSVRLDLNLLRAKSMIMV